MAYPIGKLTLHRALGTNCTSTEGLYNKMQTYAKLFTYLFRKFLAPEYSLQSVKHCDCSQLTRVLQKSPENLLLQSLLLLIMYRVLGAIAYITFIFTFVNDGTYRSRVLTHRGRNSRSSERVINRVLFQAGSKYHIGLRRQS